MHLTCKMKFNIGVIISFCIQEPFALCKVNQVPVLIHRNISRFKAYEFLELFRIVAGDPAGFIKRQVVKLNFCSILMQETVLNYFELQFTNTSNNFFNAAVLRK